MEKTPLTAVPFARGVSATDQVCPRSLEENTRAAVPPVTRNRSDLPRMSRHVPLAANAASPARAGMGGDRLSLPGWVQLTPSVVEMRMYRLSTGSLIATQFFASQQASASKKAFGSGFVICSFPDFPPFTVSSMRDDWRFPMLTI